MTDMTLVVTDVTTRGDNATIQFEDGHRAVFEGYTHGWGYQIEGLRRFRLINGDRQVVQYDSRLRRMGPSDDEHRFVEVAEGYPVERIVAYWEAAQQHIRAEFDSGNERLWFAWRVTSEGWQDLEGIKEGRRPLP